MSISDRIRKKMEEGSWIRRMFEEGMALKKRYGEANVFDLSLGNPVLEPPAEFNRELKILAGNPLPGMHRYMANAGYPDTRAAVAAHLAQETGIQVKGEDVVMTCGAAGALNVVLRAILNPDEEVIVFAPFFLEFINYIENHGGAAKIIPSDKNFIPRLDALEAGIGPKTKAVIINSPNNPTGVVYDEDFMHKLGEVLNKKSVQHGMDIYLISDEAYRKIIYDGLRYTSPLNHYPQSIVAASHSKDLGLAGERIGYIALHSECRPHKELLDGIIYCNRTLGFVNAPALMQRLVTQLQNVTVAVDEYQRKRDFLYGHLVEMGYRVMKPQGAFYMFPESPLKDDVTFVRELLQYQVLTSPGTGFGMPGYFRICYSVDDRTLEGSLNGFRKAAEKYKLR
ncbi:MAG: aspartate aminotransferase [Chloroflexi bacterium RBG_16_50_9]|nr:MAG: aspartate aminotransferase [Chloroflexi bacterium RBG_16_50_9]